MERVLLLYRDARGTDTSVAPHVKVILDSGSFTWDSMHNTYGVPANADGDTTITFIAFWSGIYRKCYYDQGHNLHGSAVSSNSEYFDEAALGFYKFTSTSKKIQIFPYVPFNDTQGNQIEIHEFTYSAKRMGDAPTITANFFDYECYDKKWNTNDADQKKVLRYYNIFTLFNGERYYLKTTPTSQYSNTDARYKHTLQFLSERDILAHTIMFDSIRQTHDVFNENTAYQINDVVQYGALYYQFIVAHPAGPWNISHVTQIVGVESPLSQSAKFSFYGTAPELVDRINGVLVQSGITSYDASTGLYDGYHLVFDYYEQFSTSVDYVVDDIVIYNNKYYIFTQKHDHGAWNSNHVKSYTLPADVVSFENNTIFEAIQLFDSIFELMYYFDQKTVYIKKHQNTITTTIQQGVNDALLSIDKQNKNTDIVSRMTGVGSEDNIPYYYPNPTEDGFLKPQYTRDDQLVNTAVIAYPSLDDLAYNTFAAKNRLSTKLIYGLLSNSIPLPSNSNNITYSIGYGRVDFIINVPLHETESFFLNVIANISGGVNASLNQIRLKQGSTTIHNASNTEYYNDKLITAGDYNVEIKFTSSNQFTYEAPDWHYFEDRIHSHINNTTASSTALFVKHGLLSDDEMSTLFQTYSINDSAAFFSWYYIKNAQTLPEAVCLYMVGYNLVTTPYGIVPYPIEASAFTIGTDVLAILDASESSFNIDHVKAHLWNPSGNMWQVYDGYYRVSGTPRNVSLNASTPAAHEFTADELFNLLYGSVKTFNQGWRLDNDNTLVELASRALTVSYTSSDFAKLFDTIVFVRELYLQPQSRLMPELYWKTNGLRRFYDAIQYPIRDGVASHILDVDAGEQLSSDGANPIVINKYYQDAGGNYIVMENPYENGNKKEYIGEYDDIKPSIKEAKNGGLRIDVVQEFAYDLLDNDELIEVTGNENDQLSYQHPYFFAKLRPLGFNLFDMAIDEGEMIVNFNTGSCGSCSFKVMVGEKYKQNTVRIWQFDAYKRDSESQTGYTIKYHQGDLMRYDEESLYKKVGTEYELITGLGLTNISTQNAQRSDGVAIIGNTSTQRSFRTWGDVICTDVKLSSVEATQKDTTSNYVWVCLLKDIETFDTIMPSKVHLLTPKAIKYEDDNQQTQTRTEDEADKFVFTHIKMPQSYIRNAEIELTTQIVKDMAKMNTEGWGFGIKFSRIYYQENTSTATLINENALFSNVIYDSISYKLSVDTFTYKIQGADALPEITVQLEDLLVKTKYRKKLGNGGGGGGWPWIRPDNPDIPVVRRRDIDTIRNSASRINSLLALQQNNVERIYALETTKPNIGIFNSLNAFTNILGKDNEIHKLNIGYPEFSTSVAYLKDTVVKKDGLLYRFTSNKSAGAWDANKVTQTNIGAEDGISRQVGKDADTKASNILTDLGFQLFDSTRSYSENEIVVYNNRLYRFTTSKSVGNWDVSKVALDSVANCVFRSLGLEEYNSSSTQTIRRGTSFFKNGKAFIATQDFIPSQVGVDVSRVTNPYNVVAMTATDSDTKALSQTVEVLRQTVSSLNSQILDKDNGLATIVRGVNSRLATLTDDMATLANSLKENEYLAQDVSVTDAAAAVADSANAATTELTGADDSSTYNKMADVYTKEMFGAAVGVVHGEFSDEDSEYKFTKMVYNNSQYSPYNSKAFVEFSGENNYDVDDKVVYNKHLYIFTSAYDKEVESGEWNPSLVENIDDYLIKAVFLSTDAYNITSGSDFLEYGRFLDANTFCDHIYELVIKCGEAGIIYTELQKIVGEECKELVDGNDLNMITEHVWAAGGYTVLQYASLRLEMNDKIYVAAIYKEDYTRDDAHHILFDIKYIESMTVKTNDTIKDNGKTAEYNGETYFVLTRDELAKTIGDNYLYCADYEVDENILLFLSSIEVDGTTLYNCYLLKQE